MSTIIETAVASAQTNANGEAFVNNAWEETVNLLCKAYVETRKNDFKVNLGEINLYDKVVDGVGPVEGIGKKLYWMGKNGLIESYTTHTKRAFKNGECKTVTILEIKGFDPKGTAVSKKGNTYYVFRNTIADMLLD